MTRAHAWFTDRAVSIWAAVPGRSITCLAPAGCAEARGFPAFLETWLTENFAAPLASAGHTPIVVRIVPDQSLSANSLVSRIQTRVRTVIGDCDTATDGDPGERLECLAHEVQVRGHYLVLLIERFQSFARMANDATVSLLSQLRSLEHQFSVTTILISTQSCAVIRKRLPGALAFVNSAYGDNHDQAIMQVMSFEEFETKASHLEREAALEVYSLGAGPDAVFQGMIDESRTGAEDLAERSWARCWHALEPFILDLFGQIEAPQLALLEAALEYRLDASQRTYLTSLPQAGFLFERGDDGALTLRGDIGRRAAAVLLNTSFRATRNHMRLLICSANPAVDLDLEQELRAIRQVVDAAPNTDVVIDSIGAVTPDDFVAILTRFRPTILHFSGHGCEEGVVMRGDGIDHHVVTGEALASTLRGRGIDLVVLNSCYSNAQAEAISPCVGAIIGTTDKVQDEAAIRFSKAFYRTLLDGETVDDAFRDGRNALALYGLNDDYAAIGNLDRRHV